MDADSDLQSIGRGRGGGRFWSGEEETKREREHDRHMSHIELGLVRVLTDRTKPYAVRNTKG